MNNEINIILGMIAGSEAFRLKRFGNNFEIVGMRPHLYNSNKGQTLFCYNDSGLLTALNPKESTIIAKRVEDMSEEEHEIRRQKSHVDYFYNSFLSNPESERYVISKGYLPEYLAKKLTEEGINIEWR